jgi:hypothetical protein
MEVALLRFSGRQRSARCKRLTIWVGNIWLVELQTGSPKHALPAAGAASCAGRALRARGTEFSLTRPRTLRLTHRLPFLFASLRPRPVFDPFLSSSEKLSKKVEMGRGPKIRSFLEIPACRSGRRN